MLRKRLSLGIPNGRVLLAFAVLLAVCFVQFAELAHQLDHAVEHPHSYSGQSIAKDRKCEVCSYYEHVHAQQLLLGTFDLKWAVRLDGAKFCFSERSYRTLEALSTLKANRGPPQCEA